MDNTQGALTPYQGTVVQGDVLTPSASQIVNPRSVATHKFLHVLKEVIRKSGIYTAEDDLLRALDDVTAFGKHLIPANDRARVVQETDIAPVEDVRMRKPPQGYVTPATSGYQAPIDYRYLAEMIVQVQKEQAAEAAVATQAAAAPVAPAPAQPALPAGETHVITDAKPSNGSQPSSTSLDDFFAGQ